MQADQDSTRVTALAYDDAAMRAQTILLPLLFILADSVACKDDEPAGNEFGEPCGYDPETEENLSCAEELECDIGYCEEKCESDSDCQPVSGFMHTCYDGTCHILCQEKTRSCPQTLAVPLKCVMPWCEAAS